MKTERLITWSCIALTLLALWLVYCDLALAVKLSRRNIVRLIEAITVGGLLTSLVYGSLVYLFARDGYLRRRKVKPGLLDELEDRYLLRKDLPRLCVVIPSYKEEPRVVRQTVISAALCIYGARRIVVLIDDPPTGSTNELQTAETCRALIRQLHERFQGASARIRDNYSDFISRRERVAALCALEEMRRVAALYDFLAEFVVRLGQAYTPSPQDEADAFLLTRIISPCADRYRRRAKALVEAVCSLDDVQKEYRRLAAQVHIELASFERKRFSNMSHAANKAMNLNSYIGLLGKSLRIVRTDGLPLLQECPPAAADLVVPDATYILTLDADSMVLPDYLLKLVDIMEDDSTVAVAQTPYSAVPGSANPLERAAGAQTDLQYIVHQGSTAANATFWVGANALLRVSALRTVKTMARERGFVVPVYIQDRTVIEDTGSTLDLIRRGWKLHNHPERLAYSATPPDFGSLIIQRRRWANGGLIIFADLLRHVMRRSGGRPSLIEFWMRAHYLCGPALTSFSVLLLLTLSFSKEFQSGWVIATFVPYFALYARDARSLNYRWEEVALVYALSLMLLPVTLAGVLRSIQQIATGRKSSFSRTPKIQHRTPMPAIHVVLQIALIAAVGVGALTNALDGKLYFAALCALNFALLLAGFSLFIGPRAAWCDMATVLPSSWLAKLLERRRRGLGRQSGDLHGPDHRPGWDTSTAS
jgi:cellulose synthase (UDP-forming)